MKPDAQRGSEESKEAAKYEREKNEKDYADQSTIL